MKKTQLEYLTAEEQETLNKLVAKASRAGRGLDEARDAVDTALEVMDTEQSIYVDVLEDLIGTSLDLAFEAGMRAANEDEKESS